MRLVGDYRVVSGREWLMRQAEGLIALTARRIAELAEVARPYDDACHQLSASCAATEAAALAPA